MVRVIRIQTTEAASLTNPKPEIAPRLFTLRTEARLTHGRALRAQHEFPYIAAACTSNKGTR